MRADLDTLLTAIWLKLPKFQPYGGPGRTLMIEALIAIVVLTGLAALWLRERQQDRGELRARRNRWRANLPPSTTRKDSDGSHR